MAESAESTATARRRRGLVMTILVVGTLVGLLAVFGVWAKRQLLETETWTETSSELLADEEIQDAVATFLVDELFTYVDVQAKLEKRLPPDLKPLSGPAAGGIRELADRAAHEAVKNPKVQSIWEDANRAAHERLLAVVEGDSEVLVQGEDSVNLDLGVIVERLGEGVGINVADKLPPEAAQIQVIEGDQIEEAQDGVALFKDIAYGLVIAFFGLYGLAIFLAKGWRREVVRDCGFGFIAIGILVLVGRSIAGSAVVDSLATTEAVEPAANSAWTIGTSLLGDGGVALIGYGVVIIAGAWLAGPGTVASSLRRELTPVFRERVYGYALLVAIVALVLVWSPTEGTRRLLPSLILLALLVAGYEALRSQSIRDFPDEDTEKARERWRARGHAAREAVRGRGRAGGVASSEAADEQRIAQLERLARLHDAGTLDDDEFEREKQRVLSS
jgi:Short C-terminal domain